MGEHICSLISVHRLRVPHPYFNRLLYPTVVSVSFLLSDSGIVPIHDMVLSFALSGPLWLILGLGLPLSGPLWLIGGLGLGLPLNGPLWLI